MLQAGQVLNGRYKITRTIGKGGMSVVYQATDLNNGKILAIKDVARAGEKDHLAVEQTLVTEARMLMQLDNGHLPKIYDILEQSDSFMMVMDYIAGESLDKVIAREGAQPVERVLNWGMQICEVFTYLHNQPVPIIYRDMKPANVILQPDGILKMIDFGTARTQKTNVAMQADTLCLGTAGFAAPEQFGGFGQSTPRTDIFCLGATLYNMVTGHSPCERPQGILPLERWNPALKDSPISYIITKCTRNDPDARYQTAQELYHDLYQASIGAFKPDGGRGSSGRLNNQFQKQAIKSANGGLSGLLNRGRSGILNKGNQSVPVSAPLAAQWQKEVYTPVEQPPMPTAYQPQVPTAPTSSPKSVWRLLMLVCLIIAVAFVTVAIIAIAFSAVILGIVSVIFAVGVAILAAIGAVFSQKTS